MKLKQSLYKGNKIIKKKIRNNRYVFLSGLFVLLIFGIIFIVFSMFPFGNNLLFKHDLYHQYSAMFVELYDKITQHKSLLYSWKAGGSVFLGDYFNYLSSPLTYIILLFKREQVAGAINILIVIKAILSAMTFTYYLKTSQKEHSYVSVAFSLAYVFSGYFLAYYWNIMWLDAMILLPIITLGIEKIIDLGKGKIYLISLVIMFISNYYMGYMLCIYSVVYFFIYYFSKYGIKDKLEASDKTKRINSKFISRGVTFAFYSLLAGMLCACFLVPVYNVLKNCSATSDSFPTTVNSYFDLFDFLTSHLAGLEPTFRSKEGDVLPNIYCSIIAVISVVLYYLNKDIKLKEKISYTILLIFFIMSFNTNITNFVWNAFHVPNDIPYRYSFMYVFIFLIMAVKGVKHIKSIEYKDIMYVGIAFIILIAIMQKNATDKMNDFTIIFSLVFVVISTFSLLFIKNKKLSKKIVGLILTGIIFFETFISGCLVFSPLINQATYTKDLAAVTRASNYIKTNNNNLYRTELVTHNTNNDSRLYKINGVSNFSSVAYENFSHFQQFTGVWSNGKNSFRYCSQTPVYDMMYGVKYIINTQNNEAFNNDYYKLVYTDTQSNVKIYENKCSLPLCFAVSSDIGGWSVKKYNPFETQSKFVEKSTGINNIYSPATVVDFETDNNEFTTIDKNGEYNYPVNEKGNISTTIEATKDGNMYIVAFAFQDNKTRTTFTFEDNTKKTQETDEPYIYNLGYRKKREKIKVSMNLNSLCNDDMAVKTTPVYFYAYTLNQNSFDKAYSILKNNTIQNIKYSDSQISGTVVTKANEYIYTSIPYDSSWVAYVDGKKVETISIGSINNSEGAQITIPVNEGKHKIVLKYRPKGTLLGICVSLIGLLSLVILCYNKKKTRDCKTRRQLKIQEDK